MRRPLLVVLAVAATACGRSDDPHERAMAYLEAVRDSAWTEVAELADSAGVARGRAAHASARGLVESAVRDGTFLAASPSFSGNRAHVQMNVPCAGWAALLSITLVRSDDEWVVTYMGTDQPDCEVP